MLSGLSSHAGELKSQGAAEAARDPNSKVTSEDAERKMVEESRRAGIAAFQFDPNASAEEKAAQAHSVSFPDAWNSEILTLKSPGFTSGISPPEEAWRCSNCHRYCKYKGTVCGIQC